MAQPQATLARPNHSVRSLTREQKIEEALRRGVKLLPSGLRAELEAFLSPASIGLLVGTLLIWALAHVFGVGEAADLLVLIAGVGFVGWGFWGGFRDLIDFAVTAMRASSEQELNRAAFLFQRAVITLGVNTLLALLLKRPLTSAASRTGRLTQLYKLRPGLRSYAGPPPAQSGVTVKFLDPRWNFGPGTMGTTDAYGNIKISNALGPRDLVETLAHEEGHSFLSPRARLLREFRADLRMNTYQRSVMLRYLEEAIVETRAVIKASRMFDGGTGPTRKNLLNGLRFPTNGGYDIFIERLEPGQEPPLIKIDIGTQGAQC